MWSSEKGVIIATLIFQLLSCTAQSVEPFWVRSEASGSIWKSAENVWGVGANFVPSTAVNELQMWQMEDFDEDTIDRELGYAQALGFNALRVFLHNLLFDPANPDVLIGTMDRFLNMTASRNIGVMFVLLDSCWNPNPVLGPQPDPIPYVHNSQWVQAPGEAIVRGSFEDFEKAVRPYVEGVVSRFGKDSRVIAWDLWNEPDNSGYSPDEIAPLLDAVFDWTEAAAPMQPKTTPVWQGHNHFGEYKTLTVLQQVQISRSDVVSFHHYGDVNALSRAVRGLQTYEKPIVCTEYMARGKPTPNSYFDPNMGYMRDVGVAAFSWGLVSGLTQTIYPWDSAYIPYDSEPDPWFHDILHADGSPKYAKEWDYIRNMTGANR